MMDDMAETDDPAAAHARLHSAMEKFKVYEDITLPAYKAWYEAIKAVKEVYRAKTKDKTIMPEEGKADASLNRFENKYWIMASYIPYGIAGALGLLEEKRSEPDTKNKEIAAIANPQSPHMRAIADGIRQIQEQLPENTQAQAAAKAMEYTLAEIRTAYDALPLLAKKAATQHEQFVTHNGSIVHHFGTSGKNQWTLDDTNNFYNGSGIVETRLAGLNLLLREGKLAKMWSNEAAFDLSVIGPGGIAHSFNYKRAREKYPHDISRGLFDFSLGDIDQDKLFASKGELPEEELLAKLKRWETEYPPQVSEKTTRGLH